MKSDRSSVISYRVSQGTGALVFSDKGLIALILPYSKEEEFQSEVLKVFSDILKQRVIELYNKGEYLIQPLVDYFGGRKIKFDYVLDLKGFSEFERKVYGVVASMPHGELRSYKWVAEAIGKPNASRAVGNALAKNPIPIVIPCHRIVKSDGKRGGWSGKEGWKRKLLELEGLRIEN